MLHFFQTLLATVKLFHKQTVQCFNMRLTLLSRSLSHTKVHSPV